MKIVPSNRPRPGCAEIARALAISGFGDPPKDRAVIVGFRPWFAGNRPGNERGIYDDAIVIWSPTCNLAFNGNTDPSIFRKGRGTGEETKGVAVLKAGAWLYQIGIHRHSYTALVQAGEVTVIRDGDPPYPDTGWFGINIHRGSYNGTSSLGCQTIYPDQWESFIATVQSEMKRYRQKTIPYALVDWREVA